MMGPYFLKDHWIKFQICLPDVSVDTLTSLQRWAGVNPSLIWTDEVGRGWGSQSEVWHECSCCFFPLSLSNSDFDGEEGWEGDSNPPPSLRSPVVVRFHMEIKKTLTRADFFLSLEGERNFDGAGHSPSTRTNQGPVLQSSGFRFSALRNCKLHSFGEN